MIMNRSIFKYAFIGGIVIGVIAAVIILITGREKTDKEMTPEAAVEAFYSALSQGDFASAREFCDPVSMEAFLNSYEAKWEEMRQMDSTIAEIAAAILSTAEIEFIRTEKADEGKKVYFLIDATMGMKKEKVATLKKEKKAWRVETITDAV